MAYNTRLRFLTTPGGGGRRILLPHLHTADIAIKPECWSTQLLFTAAKIGGRDPRWVVGFGFWKRKVLVIIILLVGLVLSPPVTGYLRIWPSWVIFWGGSES